MLTKQQLKNLDEYEDAHAQQEWNSWNNKRFGRVKCKWLNNLLLKIGWYRGN